MNRLSQFLEETTDHLYKHLKGTKDFRLYYKKDKKFDLDGHADIDFGSDLFNKKSHTGYAFCLGGNTILWKSVKQKYCFFHYQGRIRGTVYCYN